MINELVVCCGTFHVISLMPSGALVLRDHEKGDVERVVAALRGETSYCHKVLEAWRRKDERMFKSGLLYYALCVTIAKKEKRQELARVVDPLTIPLKDRIKQRITTQARGEFQKRKEKE